tara:strand:- start:250 stop:408 length:159 start_codon:yes stop_codon:yes gene_type:complete
MNFKQYHKELKKQVNVVEEKRNTDRTSSSWYELKELKKQKLKTKDQLNETKQ